MSTMKPDALYQLLPAIYRQQDVVQGEPLRAFMGILQQALQNVQNDVDTDYNNCFIETCETWVIPYIADLLGISGFDNELLSVVNQRARVANTIRYRRRKGQGAIIEQVVDNVTGWSSRLIEFFRYLAVTQHIEHIRPGSGATASIRDVNAMANLNGPFDTTAHTAEVCGSSRPLKYNISIVGLFIWRLQSNSISRSAAFAIDPVNKPGCYTFNPLGLDMPLFTLPQPLTNIAQRVTEINLPTAISLTILAQDLTDNSTNSNYYGPNKSIYLRNPGSPNNSPFNDPSNIVALDLSQWAEPPAGKVAIDPRLGRIKLATDIILPMQLQVNYQFGFGANIGGGSYDRHTSLATAMSDTLVLTVSKTKNSNHYPTLNNAYNAWQSELEKYPNAIIEILDDGVYQENIEWNIDSSQKAGSLIIEATDGKRPCLICPDSNNEPRVIFKALNSTSKLQINGLLIDGTITLNGSMQFNLPDTTIVPRSTRPGISIEGNYTGLIAVIQRSIVGAIRSPAATDSGLQINLQIFDSIIDGVKIAAIAADDLAANVAPILLHVERSTISGTVHVTQIDTVSESILINKIVAEQVQKGCVRYSSLPLDSRTPPRYRCQPELGYHTFVLEQNQKRSNDEVIINRLTPIFIATQYGDPNYMQLSLSCDPGITTGAQDGSEMGAYKSLAQPQRSANLTNILNEFLPFGLQADIFYADAKRYFS